MRKLIVGGALLVGGLCVFSVMNIRVAPRAMAQAQVRSRATFEDDDAAPRTPGPVPVKNLVKFSPTEFEAKIQAAEHQLSQHLKGLAERNEAAPARDTKLLKAMQSYLGDAKLSKIIAELESVIKGAPDTEEAKRAAAAIESLKAGAAPIPDAKAAPVFDPNANHSRGDDPFDSNSG